jgi:hypothetical protein
MAWHLDGTYFETCSCNVACPCTFSLDLGADNDRCNVLLAFHIDSGEIEGVDVSGLTVALLADTPKVMTDGSWRLGVLIDGSASDQQVEKLGAVFGGQHGGPMEMLAPLIGEQLGMERVSIDYADNDGRHSLRAGDGVDVEVEDLVPFGKEDGQPVRLEGAFHPASSTLTVARATKTRISAFGIQYEGKSAFSAPFSWSG